MPQTDECKVSILITFYNQKDYVEQCLSSVINQKTVFPFEVLCGDDNSDDGTYEELLNWQSRYSGVITVFRTDEDRHDISEPIIRASHNRLKLLENAKGRYVCFLDGDDYYPDPGKLQKQFDVLEKYPEITGCFHPLQLKWDDGEHPDVIYSNYSDKAFSVTNKSYWGNLWSHAGTFMFRNIDSSGIGRINKDFFDDNLITASFIRTGRIMYIPDVLGIYRQSGSSSWNKRSDLEKNYVNLLVYQEAKKALPDMRLQSFIKCYDCIKFFFDNRNTDIDNTSDSDLVLNESIYLDTIRYGRSGAGFRFVYTIKWSLKIFFGFLMKKISYKIHLLSRKYIQL